MRVISITSLLVITFMVLSIGRDAHGSYISPNDDDPELSYWDAAEDEYEDHRREARSPFWGRRFRVKIKVPNPVKKAGNALGKTFGKVANSVKGGIWTALRITGVDKLASKATAEIKKAAGDLEKALNKAKERIKPIAQTVEVAAKGQGILALRLLQKLQSMNYKELDGEDNSGPTPSAGPSKPGCGASCRLMKNLKSGVNFFKQSFCTFYSVKRNHRDFLNDRNTNLTAESIINVFKEQSFIFYQRISVEYNKLAASWNYTKLGTEGKKKVSKDCSRGQLMPCDSTVVYDALVKLKCFKACHGFDGCEVQDERLMQAVDLVVAAYLKKLELIIAMLKNIQSSVGGGA